MNHKTIRFNERQQAERVNLSLFCIQLTFHGPSPYSHPLLSDPANSIPDIGFFAGLSTSPRFPPPINISQRSAGQHDTVIGRVMAILVRISSSVQLFLQILFLYSNFDVILILSKHAY